MEDKRAGKLHPDADRARSGAKTSEACSICFFGWGAGGGIHFAL